LGPDALEQGWDKVKKKFIDAARVWRQAGTSLLYSIALYNVYLLPKMQFMAQLDPLPSDWAALEAKVLRTLIRGPYQWVLPVDLKSLKKHFAFPAEAHDLRVVEKAAKVRVALREAEATGGLCVVERAGKLEQLIRDSDEDSLLSSRFFLWFKASRLIRLRDTLEWARSRGVTRSKVDEALANGTPRPWPRKVARRVKKGTQAFCRVQLAPPLLHPYGRMRKRLTKWPLEGWLHDITCRSFRILKKVSSLAPPGCLLQSTDFGGTDGAPNVGSLAGMLRPDVFLVVLMMILMIFFITRFVR